MSASSAQPADQGGPHKESGAGQQSDGDTVGNSEKQVNGLHLEFELIGKDGNARIIARFDGVLLVEREINVMEAESRQTLVAAIMAAFPSLDHLSVVQAVVSIAEAALARLHFDQPASETAKPDEEDDDKPQKDLLVELATGDRNVELFHTPGRHEAEPYASIRSGKHRQTLAVFSKPFRFWLVGRYYEIVQAAPGSQALNDALNAIAAVALYKGPEHQVFVRIAERDGAIWIDLGDDDNRAVLVTRNGWICVAGDKVPVRFVRRRGMKPLVAPIKGGSIHELRGLVNVRDDRAWILLLTVVVSYLWPRGPFVILIVNGEQGSAKSTLCRFLRLLIDPNQAPLRRPAKDDRDLMIAASNGWIVAFDNLSGVPPSLSDALCSLATGGGFATRELYTDSDEKLFDAMRPVLLNGISDLASRPDLLDRAVTISLPAIPEEKRRDETKLQREFERRRPRLFGSLLDVLAAVLRTREKVTLAELPRMADFAILGAAAAPALGWKPEEFLDAYRSNREEAHSVALESSVIGPPILDLMQSFPRWEGPAKELLQVLVARNPDPSTTGRRDWPKSARGLREALARIVPNLRAAGIDVVFPPRSSGGKRERRIVLERREPRPPRDDGTGNGGESPGRSWDGPRSEDRPSENGPGRVLEGIRDGRDEGDGRAATGEARPGEGSSRVVEPPDSEASPRVGEGSSLSSPPSQNGHGASGTPVVPGRSRDGCPSEGGRIVPPKSTPNEAPRDDGDGLLPITDLVLESFGGVVVSDLRADGNAPAPPPRLPHLPRASQPKAASPTPPPSKPTSASPGFAFEGMDSPEVPYD